MGKPRTTPRRILGAAAALVGIILAAAAILLATVRADAGQSPQDFDSPQPPTTTAPAEPAAPGRPPASTVPRPARIPSPVPTPGTEAPPRELSIPRLDLRAPVDPVGVADDGRMQVPEDPDRVGWYRHSPAPGAPEGSSVLVGHVDAEGRGLGVLVGLNDVRKGDRVQVGRGDGTVVTYEITARRTVGKAALAASGVFDRDGPAVLTLITCVGPYLPDNGGYQNNLVVTAVEASVGRP